MVGVNIIAEKPVNLLAFPSMLLGFIYTIIEKFTQYFTSAAQDTWIQLLGEIAKKDSIIYKGIHCGWLDYLQAVQALKIPGFQDVLTAFQLVNFLVFLGITSMPNCKDISYFIY